MNPIRHSIAKARFRVFLQDTLTALGWSALAAMLAGTAIFAANQLVALGLPWWVCLVPGVAAIVAAPVWARFHRPDDATIAALIDDRLQLKDRLATALFASQLTGDAFATRVIDDAQQVAAGLNIKKGFAVKFTRVWGYVPPAAALVALLAVFLPMMDPLGAKASKAKQKAEEANAQEAQQQVTEVLATLDKVKVSDPALRDNPAESALKKELAELSTADLRDPEMRRNAVAKLSEAQEKLDQTAEQKQNEVSAMQNAMSRLENDKSGPADQFADALRRGDFNAANEELKKLADQVNSMPEGDKEALKQQLESLSEQLKQAAQNAIKQQAQAQQQTQQTLQQAGLSQQQIQQLQQQNFNQQAVQQALQKQGMSQQQAQQTAKQIQQQQNQSKSSQQCQNSANGLAAPLGQMSKAMSGASNAQNGTQQQQQQQSQQQQQQQQAQSAANQASQQLQQMTQMQQQLQQMQQSQGQMQKAMNSMCNRPGNSPGQSKGGQMSMMQSPFQQGKAGVGGHKADTGTGDNKLGEERKLSGYQTTAEGDIVEGRGKVITSWTENGEMAKGEAQVTYDQAITEARKDAEQAITEDRVPKRYHESIKKYFDQVPTSADRVAPKSAPK